MTKSFYCKSNNQLNLAIEYLQQYLVFNSSSIEATIHLVDSLLKTGQYKTAKLYLDEIFALEPTNHEIIDKYAFYYSAINDTKNSIKFKNLSIKLRKNSPIRSFSTTDLLIL